MNVSVVYQDKKYMYKKIGSIMTWTDSNDLVVPVFLHTALREKALSEGIDSSVFLSHSKEEEKEEIDLTSDVKPAKKVSVKRNKMTKSLLSGFNPLKK